MHEAQLAGSTVLIVEDEALLRRQLAALLEELGAEVTQAETVEAARRLRGELGFDLVLLDVNLPDGKGTTLLKERVISDADLWKMLGRRPGNASSQDQQGTLF